MKSVLILALGATMATLGAAGTAAAQDYSTRGVSAASMAAASQAGRGRDCECNAPVVNVPFYTVRSAAAPIRVRAPGIRISSAPVYVPSPSVYVQGPPIYVDAPPVQVAPAQVYLEAPDVHVRPSDVNVAPPEIHFTPASGEHTDEHCCDVASPPSAPLAMAPPHHPTTAYPAPSRPVQAPAGSGYRQEPGERG